MYLLQFCKVSHTGLLNTLQMPYTSCLGSSGVPHTSFLPQFCCPLKNGTITHHNPNEYATMNLDRVTPGKNVPDEINVIIEIPAHSDPVKYEVDKETGAMFVDRFMNTAMHYPCNYGYVPHTLSEDGDPVDVLVITPIPLISGSVICCRPISMMKMTSKLQ